MTTQLPCHVPITFTDELEDVKITWIWPNWIPDQTTTILFGGGGVGKSTVACDFASRLSLNRPFPDSSNPFSTPVGTLFLTHEDRPAASYRRKIAACGPPPYLQAFASYATYFDEASDKALFEFPKHLEHGLSESLHNFQFNSPSYNPNQYPVKLVVVDPLNTFKGDKVDPNQEASIRPILESMNEFAATHDLAFLCLCHTNKNASLTALERTLGSVAINNVARSSIALHPDPENRTRRLLVLAKHNYTEEQPAIGFHLQRIPNGDYGDVAPSYEKEFHYVDPDHLFAPRKLTASATTPLECLRTILSPGPQSSHHVKTIMQERYGFSESTTSRAFRRSGFYKFKQGRIVFWSVSDTNPFLQALQSRSMECINTREPSTTPNNKK